MKINSALAMKFLVALLFVCTYVISSPTSGDLNWWCNQTPNPEPCKYHLMSHISKTTTTISRKQFLTMAGQTALDHLISGLDSVKLLEPRVLNNAERSAWSNCMQLYHLTANSLRKILDVRTMSTAADVQIWLSAASTHVQMCHDGFFDAKMTTNIYSRVVSNNVTHLIRNCLAVNKVLFDQEDRTMQQELISRSFPANHSHFKNADCVVAQDGSGDYTTITDALAASANRSDVSQRFVIQVKQGTYAEYPVVTDQMQNIMIVGEGMDKTIVTGNQQGSILTDSATFKVYGEGFVAKGITFENTAGVSAGPEIALYSAADHSAFYQCGFKGYQDTLLAGANRQFYRECNIYGTVDYIFGDAAVVFQQCNIYASKSDRGLVITAQGRNNTDEPTGTVIQNCQVLAGPDLPAGGSPVYLGRPWFDYSKVIVMQSFLNGIVNPSGWMEWQGADPSRDSTLYYAEFNNKGPGSSTDGRVQWPGYHIITDASDVQQYSVANFIDGNSWLPETGVPFDSGI